MRMLHIALLIVIISIVAINVIRFYSMTELSDQSINENNTIVIIGNGSTLPVIDTTSPTYKPTNKIETCSLDSDCSWIITNCCKESGGAFWECFNKDSYIDCESKETLCPQFLSPKPSNECSCQNLKCTAG